MIKRKIFPLLLLIICAGLIYSCGAAPSKTPVTKISEEDQGGEPDKETFPTPEDTENIGSAVITYTNAMGDPNYEHKVKVSIPVTIHLDPDNPAQYKVDGFNQTTVYLKTAALYGGEICWLRCDYQPIYYAEGRLVQDYTKGCIIRVKFSGDFFEFPMSRSYDCPSDPNPNAQCGSYIISFGDDHTYEFTKQVPYDLSENEDSRVLQEARISEVNMPGSLMGVCDW